MKIPDKIREQLSEIIKKAGAVLLSYYRSNLQISKKSDNSFVTNVDLEVESFLKISLSKVLPNSSFWGEELGKTGENDYCWVIDPLDGTSNFIYNIPFFCISIALTYLNDPILGIIYDPVHNDLFYAEKGSGFFLNGKQIYINKNKEFSNAFVVFGPPGHNLNEKIQDITWKGIKNIRDRVFGIRITGSTALDQAYVASGRFDASFYFRVKWWDIAAGLLLVKESGGAVSDLDGNKIVANFDSFSYASSSDSIQNQLLKTLS